MGDLGSCNPSLFVGIGERRRGKQSRAPAGGIPAPGEVAWVTGRASLEERGGTAHRAGKQECGLGMGWGICQTHSPSLSDVDPGAHNVIRRHGLEGG